MSDKTFIVMTYGLLGILLAILPILYFNFGNFFLTRRFQNEVSNEEIFLIVISFAILWMKETSSWTIMITLATVSVVTAWNKKRVDYLKALAILSGLAIACSLPWWRHGTEEALNISGNELCVFAGISILTLHIFSINVNKSSIFYRNQKIIWKIYAIFVALMSIVLSFATSNITNNELAIFTTWHHWGAYIQSSKLLLSGLKIFYDFPAQYGLGPTGLIALTCEFSCWQGTYFLTGLFHLGFFAILSMLALDYKVEHLTQRMLILLLCFFTTFFWIGAPFSIMSSLVYPSVGGLRFLPVLGLTFLLVQLNKKGNPQRALILGHIAWVGAVLWSVESAFYATFVWWPYYLFLNTTHQYDQTNLLGKILKSSLVLLGWLTLLLSSIVLVYWSIYRVLPDINIFFAYAISPPGPLPIDWHGSIWFYICVMCLGTIANWKVYQESGNTPKFRRSFIFLLLSFATFSYFLGRSHDNNILNLLPFQLLVLLEVRRSEISWPYRQFATVMLTCLLSLGTVFEWGSFIPNIKKLEFSPSSFLQKFSYENIDTFKNLSESKSIGNPQDVLNAISLVRDHYDEPYTVVNEQLLLASIEGDEVWNTMHNWANYYFFYNDRRRELLSRGASNLNRTGWIIYHKKFPHINNWLADYDLIYLREKEVDFQTYQAIRFSPR